MALSWFGVVWNLKMPPEQVLRNEQRLGSPVIRRTAEQLVGRFNPESIALAIRSSVHQTELSARDVVSKVHHRVDMHLPNMPTRGQLLAEARTMFAKTISLDDIVDRAYELLVESVASFLAVPPLVAVETPYRERKSGILRGRPHIR